MTFNEIFYSVLTEIVYNLTHAYVSLILLELLVFSESIMSR